VVVVVTADVELDPMDGSGEARVRRVGVGNSVAPAITVAGVLFPNRLHDGLRDGSITLTFRHWSRPQVKVGGRYRTGGGDLVVESIEPVEVRTVTDAEAQRAGFADAAAMRAERGWADDLVVLRIAFHREDATSPPSPRPLDDAEIGRRLDRLDAVSPTGPWTRPTLDAIARHPAVRAGDLAAELGRERLPFKADVRKLKRLGLTESLDVGYRLSPRGQAYLDGSAGRR
jgi:hypothetical protein